ncbi:MAG: ion transporter [Planctomycetes bacterium]|nr:ion transporter [Planctomycetota bacterium]
MLSPSTTTTAEAARLAKEYLDRTAAFADGSLPATVGALWAAEAEVVRHLVALRLAGGEPELRRGLLARREALRFRLLALAPGKEGEGASGTCRATGDARRGTEPPNPEPRPSSPGRGGSPPPPDESALREIDRLSREELGVLDDRSRGLLADTTLPAERLAEELRGVVEGCLWIDTARAHFLGGSASREAIPLEDVFAELDFLREWIGSKGGELAGRVSSVHQEALAARREIVLAGASRILAAEPPAAELWRALREVEDLRADLAAASFSRGSATPDLERGSATPVMEGPEVAAELRGRLSARLAAAPEAESAAWVESWAGELRDRGEELLTISEDLILDEAVARLGLAAGEIDSLSALVPGRVRLSRLARRLAGECQEKKLQRRLEGLFGRRLVGWFENGILFLILAVVGILAYETFGSPDEKLRHVLAWVDGAICAVFLLDFGVRFWLAEGKGSYVRRHALIDLIPSIPFGLIAHGLAILDFARSARVLRFLRLPRLLRYVRVVRPFVQIFRVLAFLVRGADRLVRRHANLLNRSVVAFEPPAEGRAPMPPPIETSSLKYLKMLGRARAREREVLRGLDPPARARILDRRIEDLSARLALQGVLPAAAVRVDRPADLLGREIRLEGLLATLVGMDTVQVEILLGRELAEKVARYLSFFQAPVVRSLPVASRLAEIYRESAEAADPCEATALVLREIGRVGERVLASVHWFADLAGTVTAPQFVEMVGAAVVRATSRPTRRLIMIGGAFLLLHWAVALFSIDLLAGVSSFLEKFVGLPLVVLGGLCLFLLLVGQFFRRIAGEASDFYERTAEAHFLSLMEDVKEARVAQDLRLLYDRVLFAEERAAGLAKSRDEAPQDLRRLYRRIRNAVMGSELEGVRIAGMAGIAGRSGTAGESTSGYWLLEDRVLSIFRDYMDGALLHKSDTKTPSQLLGNLTLQRIYTDRLALSRRVRKRLRRLDLSRDRGVLGGAYLWFNFITQSVAQRTAKLLIDYNRHAIPLEEIPHAEESARREYENWLATDFFVYAKEERDFSKYLKKSYSTTEFTTLDFLSCDPERDRAIGERYGEKVKERLQRDRQRLVRNLFGSYPLQRLPRERRTFNPYDYYQRHLAGGRVFFYPLHLAARGLAAAGAVFRAGVRVTRDLLDPEWVPERGGYESGFDAAERKIARMRRPVYLEAARLRALYDVEYLGLCLPGETGSLVEGFTCWEDLAAIGARDSELDFFRNLSADRAAALRRLAGHLEEMGLSGERLGASLEAIRPGLSARRIEALRALSIAYALDYRGLRSFLCGIEEVEAVWSSVLSSECFEVSASKYPRRAAAGAFFEYLKRRIFLRPDDRKVAFERVLALTRFAGVRRKERKLLARAVALDLGGIAERIQWLAEVKDAGEARSRAQAVLTRVLVQPHHWTEELVTLRTVQTMAVLDVRNYRTLVWQLGRYGEGAEPPVGLR